MKKIVVIDDDPSVFLLLKDAFPKDEFHLETARDGQEGLTKVKETHPDLILLDILMPTMNGFEFLDILRVDEKINSIPVLVNTILQDEKDEETAFSKGAVGFIHKDQVTPKEVVEKVREALKD